MSLADEARSGIVDASGRAELVFTPTRRQSWSVQQVSVSAPDVGGSASCGVYRDTSLISPVVAQGDAAAGDPPVPVRLGQTLRVVWQGAIPGTTVSALILFDDGMG